MTKQPYDTTAQLCAMLGLLLGILSGLGYSDEKIREVVDVGLANYHVMDDALHGKPKSV